MPTPSNRFATSENLMEFAAAIKERYEPKDDAIVHDDGYVHTDSNYTAAEKTKLNGIATGAQVNKIEAITVGGRATTISNKTVNIPVDTDFSTSSQNPVENRVVSNFVNGMRARLNTNAPMLSDWSSLASEVAAGNGETVLPVGTQVKVEWTVTNGSTKYDAMWNAVHHHTTQLEGGSSAKTAVLQMDRCLPFDTQFSPYQAFLCAVTAIPAGTYNVKMGFSWGTHVVSGKSYQFTLTKELPAGGQLAGFYGAPDQAPSNWRVYAFSSATATSATETCVVSEGTGGTNLGTFTAAGYAIVPASGTPETVTTVGSLRFYGLNSLHRVAYGNNRWLHSALRQYLNSSGNNWWQPQTVFDRPPAYASHRGFLSGLPSEFVAQMVPAKHVTALNYVTDGGSAASPLYDTTYDKVFLPSGKEHFLAPTETYGGSQGQEGDVWEYWKRIGGAAAPLAWSSWGNFSTYHVEMVQYDLAIPNTARYVWMRSAHRGYGYAVAHVYSLGSCNSNSATNGFRAAPACEIGQS